MDTVDIIYESSELLAVNKPPGISVHPSRKEPDGTLINILLEMYPDLAGVGDPSAGSGQEEFLRPGIVHRLDKETSGVMVVARTQETFLGLKALFKERKVEKRYLALVDGIIKEPRGKIDFPVGRVGLKMGIVRPGQRKLPKQRDAETRYIVRRRFPVATEGSPEPSRGATLVEVLPKTGRMHQIRVHMHGIGRPVLGDKLYGGRAIRARAPRQMLHAWKLTFMLHGTEYAFEAELPDDFEEVLETLAESTKMGQDVEAA